MNLVTVVVLLIGASAGLGVFLVVQEFVPGVPALGPALRQLQAHPAVSGTSMDRGGPVGWLGRRLRVPEVELNLIGHTPERYITEKVGFALVGLVFPPVFCFGLAVVGLRLGILIPAGAGLALAVLFFFLVDVSVRQRAADAREEFTGHVAVYLNLVALELAASRAPSEALDRAAAVGGGWVSQRIRDCLHGSRLRMELPWDGLKQVAAEIGVPALADVGDIMTLAGEEGVQPYDTLRSLSQSLQAALLAKEHERANRATTVLYFPTSLLVLVLFIVAAYPFLIRLATS